ncbi:MAG: hypothetical protein Q7V58_17850 [Actinomycetota bacterium]|nr:hypothetical protein [Actinomycetota bacterium]
MSAESPPTGPAARRATARHASAVIVAGLIVGLVSGVALGVVWWQLAPRVPLIVQPGVSYPQGYQPEGYLAADAAFGLLGLVAGIAITIGLANMRRDHLFSVLVAALLSGAVGTAAMWFVGTRLGSVDIEGLSATTTADLVVEAPLRVSMPSMFLMWALASAVVVTVLALGDWIGEARTAKRALRAGDGGEAS